MRAFSRSGRHARAVASASRRCPAFSTDQENSGTAATPQESALVIRERPPTQSPAKYYRHGSSSLRRAARRRARGRISVHERRKRARPFARETFRTKTASWTPWNLDGRQGPEFCLALLEGTARHHP